MQWNPSVEAQLTEMVNAGEPCRKIAEALGKTIKMVRGKADRMGLRFRAGERAPNTEWPADRVEKLRSLISAGMSAREIASELGATRCSVIGKAHRIGLRIRGEQMDAEKAARAARGKYKKKYVYQYRPNRRRATNMVERSMARQLDMQFAPSTVLEGVGKVAFLDLEPWQCRWPFGDGAEMLVCGEPSVRGRSYCRCHLGMAYQPTTPVVRKENYYTPRLVPEIGVAA